MENVKDFFEYLIDTDSSADNIYNPDSKAEDCANKIADKLLLIPTKEMREAYGKMIIMAMEKFKIPITIDEFNPIEGEKIIDQYIRLIQSENTRSRFLFCGLIFLNFYYCGIELSNLVSDGENSRFIYFKITPEAIKEVISSTQNIKNEFTLYRKKEAIMTMLEELGVARGSKGYISDSNIKRFIYFLTGYGTIDDDIRNKYVSDLFKPSKDNRNNETINNDLDFVAARFEEIGLFDLALKVKNGKI